MTKIDNLNKMTNAEFIPYEKLSKEESMQILKLRNLPDISRWMYNSKEISWKEHRRFINNLKSDKKNKYWLVREYRQTIGMVNLTQIDDKNLSAKIGLIKNPELEGQTSFFPYFLDFIDMCRSSGLHKLIAETKSDNIRAQRFFSKAGFEILNQAPIITMVKEL